ncbi:uncharacterized protein LOC124244552 [Equus quagga]|uniref:uncharacterized protein LOC124244552 n=1 Tax=Equus quagga TaxID=89248 RepID=UPI001EE285B8|nr:uncharacterized protein LOC124244552 [Equus quagga]
MPLKTLFTTRLLLAITSSKILLRALRTERRGLQTLCRPTRSLERRSVMNSPDPLPQEDKVRNKGWPGARPGRRRAPPRGLGARAWARARASGRAVVAGRVGAAGSGPRPPPARRLRWLGGGSAGLLLPTVLTCTQGRVTSPASPPQPAASRRSASAPEASAALPAPQSRGHGLADTSSSGDSAASAAGAAAAASASLLSPSHHLAESLSRRRDTSFVLPPRLVVQTDGRRHRGPDCGQRQAHSERCSRAPPSLITTHTFSWDTFLKGSANIQFTHISSQINGVVAEQITFVSLRLEQLSITYQE